MKTKEIVSIDLICHMQRGDYECKNPISFNEGEEIVFEHASDGTQKSKIRFINHFRVF
jgi:hypothetical protein